MLFYLSLLLLHFSTFSFLFSQGLLVREIKAKKAPADEIKAQIEHLLLLKKELALAKGENPNPPPKKGKKNMK